MKVKSILRLDLEAPGKLLVFEMREASLPKLSPFEVAVRQRAGSGQSEDAGLQSEVF